jgi:hypothetical protein
MGIRGIEVDGGKRSTDQLGIKTALAALFRVHE